MLLALHSRKVVLKMPDVNLKHAAPSGQVVLVEPQAFPFQMRIMGQGTFIQSLSVVVAVHLKAACNTRRLIT